MCPAQPLLALFLSLAPDVGSVPYEAADTLQRIDSPLGYTAAVLCTGITGADGLALSPSGVLYAVSESCGEVYRIDPPCSPVTVMQGLDHPEGVAVDGSGVVYICEDTGMGRALALHPDGTVETISDSLQFPEGIAVSSGGDVFVSESSVETGGFPPFLTGVRRLCANGSEVVQSSLYLWSMSDIAVDGAGMVYACNELSGYAFIRESVIILAPDTGEWTVFARGLHSCEGICSTPGSFFPLYVAEEDTGGGRGRVSILYEDGGSAVVADGFQNIEDVAVDGSGRIFVSEDTTGMIILLYPPATR
ncbi:MAG: hypothetical protein JXA64_11340 [Candidatus Fermentibacteraceae bacterium]|nr:hypothetical protein [Candidatus Fermentibacteraceae bacterium]MBN2609699.1 hypothetical protein [Candidatus Fermentibacteraceae bacterium]